MVTLEPTPFPQLNAVVADLTTSAQIILGDNFTGAYLQGSLAVGDYDEHGDVDFDIVIEQPLTGVELSQLQQMHARLYDTAISWAQRLEGAYFPQAVLRRFDADHEPLWYLDNGSRQLIQDKHDDTLVVRWVLREYGIRLAGPDIKTLIDPVAADALRREVYVVMQTWGSEILADVQRLDSGWYQPYAVLSYCRMLHTLQSGRVGSKKAGARWAQSALDRRWSGLIERALAERPNQYAKVHQKANGADLAITPEFIRYALAMRDHCMPAARRMRP